MTVISGIILLMVIYNTYVYLANARLYARNVCRDDTCTRKLQTNNFTTTFSNFSVMMEKLRGLIIAQQFNGFMDCLMFLCSYVV